MATTIYDRDWERIRGEFTEDEKILLRKQVVGECICPKAIVLDAEGLPDVLKGKLLAALLTGKVHTSAK